MAKVVYNGFADIRELDASDLKKVNVTGFKKTAFRKGEPVEVTDEVAKVLHEESIFDGFSIANDDTELDLVDDTTPVNTGSQSTSTTGGDVGTTSGSTTGATTAAGDGGTTGGSTTAG